MKSKTLRRRVLACLDGVTIVFAPLVGVLGHYVIERDTIERGRCLPVGSQ